MEHTIAAVLLYLLVAELCIDDCLINTAPLELRK